jgi:hypothetical protein
MDIITLLLLANHLKLVTSAILLKINSLLDIGRASTCGQEKEVQRRVHQNPEGVNIKTMPTVTYKCPDTGKPMKKVFPYTSVGKAQADSFNKLMKGSMKNNPKMYDSY